MQQQASSSKNALLAETELGLIDLNEDDVAAAPNIDMHNADDDNDDDDIIMQEQEQPYTTDITGTELLRRALLLNAEFKDLLKHQLSEIESTQRHNTDLQRSARLYLAKITAGIQANNRNHLEANNDNENASATTTTSINGSGRPSNSKKYANVLQKRPANQYFFVDPRNGSQPADNDDTLRKRAHQEKTPLVFKAKKWTPQEKTALRKGIRQQVQEKLMAQVLNKFQRHTAAAVPILARSEISADQALKELHRETERITNMTAAQLEAEAAKWHLNDTTITPTTSDDTHDDAMTITNDNVMQDADMGQLNWEWIRRIHVPSRTAYECKKMWHNELTPMINPASFTRDEDKKLLQMTAESKGTDWSNIAQKMGNGRNALQTFRRYQRSLNVHMMNSKWSKEEDLMLTEAVKQYGERNWQQVANCLEGRTGIIIVVVVVTK